MNKQEIPYKIVNNYFLFKEIGTDALGVNYRAGEIVSDERKAHHHSLITEVYPFLYSNPNTWKKIGILLEGVRKSNIPKLYSPEKIFQDGNKTYLVYPIMKGRTFEQVMEDSIQKDMPINFDLAFSIAYAIADLIDTGSSIVVSGEKSFHGFLTPDNIIVDYDGKILLKNYGIFPYLSKEMDILAEMEKKYGAWIAPELLRKEKPVSQSDIYHLGYMLYRILTGQYFSCSPDEDFESKFSNISFAQHIPSSDKDFLTNIITFFKKTLNPMPAKRFGNIKEFKDFIAGQFHIEELSSITFNLAYYMNSMYLESMEEENKLLAKELAFVIPEEKKEKASSKKEDDHLVEDILTGLDDQKKSKMRIIIPLAIILLVVVAISTFIIVKQQKEVSKQREEQSKAAEDLKRSFEQYQKNLANEYQLKLKNIEDKAANTEAEKKAQEDEVKKLKEWHDTEMKKAVEKAENLKKEEEQKKKVLEEQKKRDEEADNQKKLDEQKRVDEENRLRAIEEQKKKDEQRKNIEEAHRTTEGQLVAFSVLSEKPVLTDGPKPVFPPMIIKKYKGTSSVIRVIILIDENGTVTDVNIPAQTPSDIKSVLSKTLKKWKYKPGKKDNVKVKVWYPVDINISF